MKYTLGLLAGATLILALFSCDLGELDIDTADTADGTDTYSDSSSGSNGKYDYFRDYYKEEFSNSLYNEYTYSKSPYFGITNVNCDSVSEDSDYYTRSTIKYNENGVNIQEKFEYSLNGSDYYTDWDSSLILNEKKGTHTYKSYYEGTLDYQKTTTHSFNDDWLIHSYSDANYTETFTYDGLNRVAVSYSAPEDSQYYSIETTYTFQGSLPKQMLEITDGEETKRVEYTISDNKVTSKKVYKDSSLNSTTIYTYNDEGFIASAETDFEDEYTNSLKEEYSWENGYFETITHYTLNDGTYTKESNESFTYDNGRLIEHTDETGTKYSYTYSE